MKRIAMTAMLLALLGAAAVVWAQKKGWSGLAKVQKIYVDDKFGGNPDGYRFAQLFEEELRKNGFTPVDDPKDADALATGTLTFMNYTEKSGAQINLWLKDAKGDELWNHSYQDRVKVGEDTVLRCAIHTGKALREDKKKALHGGSWH
jgi:hypothetical protein